MHVKQLTRTKRNSAGTDVNTDAGNNSQVQPFCNKLPGRQAGRQAGRQTDTHTTLDLNYSVDTATLAERFQHTLHRPSKRLQWSDIHPVIHGILLPFPFTNIRILSVNNSEKGNRWSMKWTITHKHTKLFTGKRRKKYIIRPKYMFQYCYV
jgi:hypothetical protein